MCPESDSQYLNGNMQGWADVLMHAGSNGKREESDFQAKWRTEEAAMGASVAI